MKNVKLMSTKKLTALLETVTDEQELTAIRAELATRQNGKIAADEAPETPEAEVPEAPADETPEAPEAEVPEKKAKLTNEEREALAEELKQSSLNHRCKVVPFNSIDWVDGTVISIIEDKRTNKVMFGVKTDDGRRIVKTSDSKLIQILDETVEKAKRVRSTKEADNTPWDDEAIKTQMAEILPNVGKTVQYPEAGAYGKEIEGGKIVEGRIVGIVPAKRTKSFLYRIEVIDPETGEKKFAHKASTISTLVIDEEFDEKGKLINEAYINRKNGVSAPEKSLNEKEAFELAELKLEKAKATFEKAKKALENWQDTFDAAKEAYEAAVAEGKTFDDEPNEADEQGDDELM